LDRARKQPFDLAVIDIMMPGMNGLEVLDELRLIAPTIKVILLTGRSSLEDSTVGLEKGAYAYLIKPVNINVLIETMHAALGLRGE
jgi:DNA-binding response OmpR family regulator